MVRCMALDRPEIDPMSATPIYRQAADHIAAAVASGALAPGARLPAERDLAEQWGIAYLTVRRAMAHLRERGVVETVQGKGTFIAERRGEPDTEDRA